MSYNELLEDVIKDTGGGCGKFQCALTVLVQLSKTIVTWTMIHMTFNGQEPGFVCINNLVPVNVSEPGVRYNSSESSCKATNISDCTSFQYDGTMHTIVSEWDLVCDRKWIVSTTTTIQMAGVLVGCLISGHLGDLIGRKPTYFMSIAILIVFNIIAYFSVSWEMYAAIRFVLGMGSGFFLTVYRNQMCEFSTSLWRPRQLGVPSWSLEAGLLALVTWLTKDWKNIHLITAGVGAPFLIAWWFVPESFRWLVTNGRYEEAEIVITKVARINGHPKPDLSPTIAQAKLEKKQETKHYSVIDLFKTRQMIVKTLALIFIWMAESYAYYGLTFGLENLAGDFYLNMFLVYAVEIPAELSGILLINRFGRKTTCIVTMGLAGLCGITNGILQHVDMSAKGALVNTFAYTSRMGIVISWLSIAVFTTETYPTVVRTTGLGVGNTSARIGGMIAPQIVFLNDSIPGMLFFLSGAVMLISTLLCCVFTETKDQSLEDTLNKHHATPEIQVFAMTGVTKQQQSAGNEKSSDTETGVCFIRL